MSTAELDRIYASRFPDAEARTKDRLWVEIGRYLQRWVPTDGRVLDIACDRGYFIRNVRAAERWATDVRDMAAAVEPEARFVRSDGLALLDVLEPGSFDTVFMSNYLEHLPTPVAVIEQLRVARELVRPGGRVVVLQPNIRLVGAAYWDFIDHRVALTEHSLVEAADAAGLETERLIVRFLPYTTKRGFLPQTPALVRAYLALPIAWRLLGGQTLYVGRRPG